MLPGMERELATLLRNQLLIPSHPTAAAAAGEASTILRLWQMLLLYGTPEFHSLLSRELFGGVEGLQAMVWCAYSSL